jgi:dihydrofolate synthase/folylpolyglutamate synthase
VTDPDARAIIEYRARELGSPLLVVEGGASAERYEVGLPGDHQRANAAVAAAVVRLLRFLMPVTEEQMARGLAQVRWPGRFQILRRGKATWVLDGAHNRDGIDVLVKTWQQVFPGHSPTLVVGMLQDKEWKEMLARLLPLSHRVILVPVESSRSVPPDLMLVEARRMGITRAMRIAGSVEEALRWVQSDPHVLVSGSLYLVGEVLSLLGPDALAGGEDAAHPPPTAGSRSETGLNEWTGGGCNNGTGLH